MSQPAPVQKRGLWIALSLSLAVNLFLIGFLVARVIGPYWGPHWGPQGSHDGPMQGMSRSLSEDGRQILRHGFRDHRDDLRQAHKAAQAAQHRVKDLLAAPELDTEALADAFQELRHARRNVEKAWQDVMLSSAAQLNQQDRQALAARQHGGSRLAGPRHRDRPTN